MYSTHPDTMLALIHQRQQELINEASERRRVNGQWPEALEPLPDTYVDQVFQGPLG